MLYMPATNFATPMLLQQTPAAQYYMLQPQTVVPTVPLLNTGFVYPGYTFVTKPVEKKDESEKKQEAQQPVQHVIHHHVSTCSVKSCPGYCELCCPWIDESCERRRPSRSRSRSPSPPRCDRERCSRRDEFDRSNYDKKHETIDEKIERIRRELKTCSVSRNDKSTETIHYYRPPPSPPPVERIPYKQHYDPPRPRPRSASCSRSRSRSRPRSASSLTREPWRSSNQNDYPWRDSHLPAYREATLARTQTPTNECHTWNETAHHRSHENTNNSTTYYSNKEYIYRPKSETEARKWYTQSTGKDADREVYQALNGGTTTTTTYKYSCPSPTYYDRPQCHSFYSDVPTTTTKTHSLHKIDTTQYHNLYGCNEPCLHVVPKQGSTLDAPYLKILNAPVTYLH